jgi:hypothetical protein
MHIKWIYASIVKYFDAALTTKHFFNGEDEADEQGKFIEIKIYGPKKERQTKTETCVEVVIDFVIHTPKSTPDVLMPHVVADEVDDTLDDIPIFKLGNGPDDDPGAQIYCLRLDDTEPYVFLGPVDKETQLNRAVLRAYYSQSIE